MNHDTILSSRDGAVLTLTLNRPAAYNSFTRPMAAALQAGLDEAAADDSIRCVVLIGEGKAFCAGQDLKEVTADDAPPLEDIVHGTYNTTVRKMRSLAKPIIAAVNGVAAGAGANIALAADLCVAVEGAKFIQAFSKIGLIPDSGGTWMLPKLIGLQRATALAYLGTPVSAPEAAAMGMIHKAIPADDFHAEVTALATHLASMPTRGLALTKAAFNAGFDQSLDAQLDTEMKLQAEASRSSDYAEGVVAFLEKRAPHFQGH
ncbi:MAG: 2-(1,2-epoxy-1,2-dihydrophenyl)acetyl-CoA isomerase [Crocinitomicaceae bacterium TMED114]|nr:MAG: 2-(1,2-epoxy-1,2-dihydrophenyl)acetyl-CoA isomerase [Crocinitomicaceae bacterium TMED114]